MSAPEGYGVDLDDYQLVTEYEAGATIDWHLNTPPEEQRFLNPATYEQARTDMLARLGIPPGLSETSSSIGFTRQMIPLALMTYRRGQAEAGSAHPAGDGESFLGEDKHSAARETILAGLGIPPELCEAKTQ